MKEIREPPRTLQRYDYGDKPNGLPNIVYAEAPEFITGATEYIRYDYHQALVDRVKSLENLCKQQNRELQKLHAIEDILTTDETEGN